MPRPAKYTREQRFRWYWQVEKEKRSVTETCKVFGVSRKCFYRWKARDYGLLGNRYLSGGIQPRLKLTYEIRKFIEEQKLRTNYGPLKMKFLIKRKLGLVLSSTIIYRYYRKRKLIKKPQRKLPWYEPMKQALIVKKQGEGVQLDVKYVYPKGRREFQFSVLDPFTKMYYFKVFSTKESVNAVTVFKLAQRHFGFKIISVQTDNGSEFRGCFHAWLSKRNIPHYFIPKKSPWWNSNVERVHKTIDDEYYQNPLRAWKTPYEWLQYYNCERIHLSLGGITPKERLESVTLDC